MSTWILGLLLISCHKPNPADGYKDINGVSHYYKTVGKGEPIVVLHGGPGMFHDYLVPYLEPLAEDYQLIFYDQRGNGGSKADLTPENFTIDQLVEDLDGLRKSFSIGKMTLIGHSWGGLLALYYGIKYPNHLKKLVLVSSAPATSEQNEIADQEKRNRYTPGQVSEIERILQSGKIQEGDIEAFRKLVYLVESVNLYDPGRIEEILSNLNTTKGKVSNALLINELTNENHFFDNYDIAAELVKVEAPTLILHGKADFIPESSSRQIHEYIPNSRLVILEKSGHYPYAEEPQKFITIVGDFLKERSPSE